MKRMHPLLIFFGWQRWTWQEAMNWLQGNGWISDNCVTPYDVALCDVRRVLTAAGAEGCMSQADAIGQCARAWTYVDLWDKLGSTRISAEDLASHGAAAWIRGEASIDMAQLHRRARDRDELELFWRIYDKQCARPHQPRVSSKVERPEAGHEPREMPIENGARDHSTEGAVAHA